MLHDAEGEGAEDSVCLVGDRIGVVPGVGRRHLASGLGVPDLSHRRVQLDVQALAQRNGNATKRKKR